MAIELKQAKHLDGVLQSLKMRPLTIAQLNDFYVETRKGRGDNPISSIKRLILNDPLGQQNILFSGYRGCGKTTELNNLTKQISDEILVLNFSINEELDPNTISHIDLYLVLIEQLLFLSKKHKIKIDKTFFKKLKLWTDSDEIKEITSYYGEANVEAEVGVEKGLGIPYFLKLFGRLKGAAKVGGDYKREITKKIEPKLTELIDNFNLLVTEVNLQLPKIKKKGLLIIVEDLDKLDLPKAEELFYNYSSQITQIKANAIYTFPISLMYHYRFTSIRNYYDNNFELPMIKVFNKDGTPNIVGRTILTDILKERMDLNLIEAGVLESFLVKSGGCIRDLFRMIQTAALKALDFNREIITRKDYCKAYWRLRNDYENSIAEKREEDETITVEAYEETLIATFESIDKKPPNNNAALDLRQNLCILSYNDTQWYDVHPLVKDYLIDKKKIKIDGADPHRCS